MSKNFFSVLKALLIAYLITGALLLLCAFFMYRFQLFEGQVRLIIMVVYGVSTFAAGMIYAKIKGKRKLLSGAFMGFLYFAVLTVISMIVNRGFYDDVKRAGISFLICVVAGLLGGIMS